MMHNACFFFLQMVYVYSSILNGTTRVLHVLSHCPYGTLAYLYSDSLLGLSYLVLTRDMFFLLLKQKAATKRQFKVWGLPSVWGGPVRKYVPNVSSWELLVLSGVI